MIGDVVFAATVSVPDHLLGRSTLALFLKTRKAYMRKKLHKRENRMVTEKEKEGEENFESSYLTLMATFMPSQKVEKKEMAMMRSKARNQRVVHSLNCFLARDAKVTSNSYLKVRRAKRRGKK